MIGRKPPFLVPSNERKILKGIINATGENTCLMLLIASGEKCPKVANNFFTDVNKNCPKIADKF